jgi:hypothetical protein
LVPLQEPRQIALDATVGSPKDGGGQQFLTHLSRFEHVLFFEEMIVPQITVSVVDKSFALFRSKVYYPVRFSKLNDKPFVRERRRVEINKPHIRSNADFL